MIPTKQLCASGIVCAALCLAAAPVVAQSPTECRAHADAIARSHGGSVLGGAARGAGLAAALAGLAKARACDALELVSSEAVQVHGGTGMNDEEETGLILKRAPRQSQTFDDTPFHRARYASPRGW
ncbi:MAG: acyl-CoA dehydrogenase family protein [Gammaproteobacteria bacterium]